MKSIILASILTGGMLLSCRSGNAGGTPTPRNYLTTLLASTGFKLTTGSVTDWRAARKAEYLQRIGALPDSIKAVLITRANRSLSFNWPPLTDAMYQEFKANGNRSNFEQQQNNHRTALNCLAIGELVTGDQKYMPALVKGLYATMAETTWVLPAHAETPKPGAGPEQGNIDLFSAETAAGLAEIECLLSDQLRQADPNVLTRISAELDRRIILPYVNRKDFWWMGYGATAPNNWNPWINSNVLTTLLFSGASQDTLNLVLDKVMTTTDYFINGYPNDGGCDEGPGYWSAAGAKLIKLLELLKSVSGGTLVLKGNVLVHNMGTYIYKMHIAGPFFVNFGDAGPQTIPTPERVYQFGDYFGDDTLRGFGAYLFSLNPKIITNQYINDFLTSADLFSTLSSTSPAEPKVMNAWQPDLKVLTVRARTASGEMFLGVQAGDNGKSHNHNDVGNFVLYVNGQPVIVDAGVGVYTATTFSKDRYTLWNTQSLWHNAPQINGAQQHDGKQYTATGQTYSSQSGNVSLSMDISRAYPPAAAVQSWTRTFAFNTSAGIVSVGDAYTLSAWNDSTRINFLTDCSVRKARDGEVIFTDATGKDVLSMTYDPSAFYMETTLKMMDDSEMKHNWGDHLTRVSLVVSHNRLNGAGKFVFTIPK